jgi:putative transposase
LCAALRVSTQGYYRWRARGVSPRRDADARLLGLIRAVHERSRGTYGPVSIRQALAAQGTEVGLNRIRRLRRQNGIYCRQKKKFRATTDSTHRFAVAPNLLGRPLVALKPNAVWIADITYVGTDEGWLYLAALLDLCTREVVGWAMDARMGRDLALRALGMAFASKRPGPGLIHHSDRGSQYASLDYQHRLKLMGMRSSMSRKGNCYDNAVAASFFATLKTELVHQQRFATRREAQLAIFEYIEVFYNRIRRHTRIGHLAPAVFASRFGEEQNAA